MKPIRAFTLIELLVVIAIIAILAAILFPVFAQAKFAAKKTVDLSNAKQIGTANYLYLNDYDDTMPTFFAYNSDPTIYTPPVHHGTEVLLLTYMQNKQIFGSPLDNGGPYLAQDPGPMAKNATTYYQAYGTSYRFDHCNFSTVANDSSENNYFYPTTTVVNFSQVQFPAETRMIRLEMMGFFKNTDGTQCAKYGYDCPAPNDYFSNWDPTGGTLIYLDSHAKHCSTSGAFDQSRVDPAGDMSGGATTDAYGNATTWYWQCD